MAEDQEGQRHQEAAAPSNRPEQGAAATGERSPSRARRPRRPIRRRRPDSPEGAAPARSRESVADEDEIERDEPQNVDAEEDAPTEQSHDDESFDRDEQASEEDDQGPVPAPDRPAQQARPHDREQHRQPDRSRDRHPPRQDRHSQQQRPHSDRQQGSHGRGQGGGHEGQGHGQSPQIRELKRHVERIKTTLRETMIELERVLKLLNDLERQQLATDEEILRLRDSLRDLHRENR